jgi:hypothetical protein
MVMHAPSVRVPEPAPGDSGDVVQALEIARALWEKGNRRDAVRWVRHAIEAADELGDSLRVAALARAVADLGTVSAPPPLPLRASTPPPPSQRPSVMPASTQRPSAGSSPPPQRPSAVSSPPPQRPSAVSSPPPQRPSAVSSPPPQRPSAISSPPSQRAVQPPPLPATAEPAAKPRPASVRPPPPIRSAPSVVATVPISKAGSSPPVSEARRRVSVKMSARDPNLLVVRPLADGQSPPPGTREAFLVMVGPAEADPVDAGRSSAR